MIKVTLDLQQAESIFQELNKELIDTLPATYDSRITFFVDTLQTLLNAENINHNECAKVIFDKLTNFLYPIMLFEQN